MTKGIRVGWARWALVGHALTLAACAPLAVAPARLPPAPTAPAPVAAPQPEPLPPPLSPAAEPARAPVAAPAAVIVQPRPQSDATGASAALLEQSRTQRAAGSMPAAKASLERALRLDPNNPTLWLELGELELQTGNNAQAATMARKAQSLAGRDFGLAARAQRLLRAAE